MPYTYFDVGANNGSTSIPLARAHPDWQIFAFEPTQQLCDHIRSQIKDLPNYHLVQTAVSDSKGKAKFNVVGREDWGCSSLLEFSERSKTMWPGRDFTVTEKIEVDVIRLDDFMVDMGIPYVNFLHIDTQGFDLKVLMGLGERIASVEAGEAEAASVTDVLYVGQNHQDDTANFLRSKGFRNIKIVGNDCAANEVNVLFSR
jgi:FkbM family methyltransferase